MAVHRTISITVFDGAGGEDVIHLTEAGGGMVDLRVGVRGKIIRLEQGEVVELAQALGEMIT